MNLVHGVRNMPIQMGLHGLDVCQAERLMRQDFVQGQVDGPHVETLIFTIMGTAPQAQARLA